MWLSCFFCMPRSWETNGILRFDLNITIKSRTSLPHFRQKNHHGHDQPRPHQDDLASNVFDGEGPYCGLEEKQRLTGASAYQVHGEENILNAWDPSDASALAGSGRWYPGTFFLTR